jgi:hypothetical protein
MSYKGKYTPKNPLKYIGNPTQIVYRSLWERKFMVYCDTNTSVLEWGSETVVVPYKSPIDKKWHRYFVDFIVKVKTKKGFTETSIIEIKPKKQCSPPKKKSRVTKTYIHESLTFAKNEAKWKAANEYAENRGWKFVIMTEDTLFK